MIYISIVASRVGHMTKISIQSARACHEVICMCCSVSQYVEMNLCSITFGEHTNQALFSILHASAEKNSNFSPPSCKCK